ncbi:TolC family protein [Permianibacter sp. IMCC34836]|uniref:TolC family protein n=1 Tax=Permianibacter fluminis TaxID=2738515 RepID=UPI0015551FA8|nr:TolC family protein [Permianibacter fluminis]NQD37944.1 TolC family protein [Permianibacter fluminis]
MSAEPSLRSLRGGRLLVSVVTASAMLTGCVSFSPDGGFAAVSSAARERVAKDVVWIRSDSERNTVEQRVAELLAKPLSVDDAVQIALLNNRGLQASYAELQLSEAALVQAARLPNPAFSMLRASSAEAGVREFKIEQALTFNIFSLITMPQATEIERRRFEQTQRAVTLDMFRLANATRKAYYTAIAAAETVRYQQQVRDAAEAAAELARRLAAVGNWNKLEQLREQSFYAEAALGLAGAEQANLSAREQLIRLLGLWGYQTRLNLPERLPDLPTAPTQQDNIEQLAMAQRLDLQAVRLHTEALAKNLGLTKTTRFINVLEFGPARVLEGARDSGYKTGYEVSFELPLFDWGGAKVATAEALYMQALNVAAETAINARSEVREAYSVYRFQYDIAKHYRDEIVPISKRISEENQLRYNGMLIGVFELLADARSQITSVNGYIDSLREFWIAQADLDMALIGKPDLNLPDMPRASATAAAEH